MPIRLLTWTAILAFLAALLHLRVAFAAPGVTLVVPVPLAVLVVLAAAAAAVLTLACRSMLQPGITRSAS